MIDGGYALPLARQAQQLGISRDSIYYLPRPVHDLYGIDVSPDLIRTVSDAVLDEVVIWQQWPLNPVYPLVFFDALRVKIRDEGMIRNKAIHIALGVRADAPTKYWACGWSRTRASNSGSGS